MLLCTQWHIENAFGLYKRMFFTILKKREYFSQVIALFIIINLCNYSKKICNNTNKIVKTSKKRKKKNQENKKIKKSFLK